MTTPAPRTVGVLLFPGVELLDFAGPAEVFVDAGKVVSTGGVTAGIDGALHVLERLCGPEAARWTGEGWMEHRGPARRDADAPRR